MDIQTKDVTATLNYIDTFIRWNSQQGENKRSYMSYHPSEWGKCLRKQQYNHFIELGYINNVVKENLTSQQIRLFDTGHTMHDRWQNRYFAKSPILKGNWKCKNYFCNFYSDDGVKHDSKQIEHNRIHGKNELTGCFKPDKCNCGCTEFDYSEVSVVDKSLNFYGHADLVLDFSRATKDSYFNTSNSFNFDDLPKGTVIADMKTINDNQWKRKLMVNGPHKEYIIQLTIYINILKADFGIIFYENKNDSSLAAFKVDKNEEMFQKISEQSKLMMELAKNKLLPPPKPLDKDEMECQYCNLKALCHRSKIWSDPNLNEKRKNFYFDI